MTESTNDWRSIFTSLTDDSGCYEMGEVNYYQDPLGVPDYSAEGMPSLFSLSNLESLGRGSVAGLLDLPYFFEGMLMIPADDVSNAGNLTTVSLVTVCFTKPRISIILPQSGRERAKPTINGSLIYSKSCVRNTRIAMVRYTSPRKSVLSSGL